MSDDEERVPIRLAPPVDPAFVARCHRGLAAVLVVMPTGEPETRHLRKLYAEIRTQRNKVARLLGTLLPIAGGLKADRERVQRIVEKLTARTIEHRVRFVGCRTERERAARVKLILTEDLDELATIEHDVALVSEVVGHCRAVLGELQAAFEEASRTLATVELDWRITHGER